MRKYLYFLIALCASLALIAVVDGAAGAEPAELSRVLVAILGKAATCVGATLFFLAVNRILFPEFDVGKVIRGEEPFPKAGEDIPRAAYIVGWCILYGATLMAFSRGGAY